MMAGSDDEFSDCDLDKNENDDNDDKYQFTYQHST